MICSAQPSRKQPGLGFSVLPHFHNNEFWDGNFKKTSYILDELLTSGERREFVEKLENYNMDICRMHSPGAYRDQLFALFVDHHCPPSLSNRHVTLAKIRIWIMVQGDAMQAVRTSLLLLSLASASGQEYVRREALDYHSKAIALFKKSMTFPSFSDNDASLYVLDAIYTCEMYGVSSKQMDTWRKHARGFCAIASFRGPKLLDNEDVGFLVMDMLHMALIDALQSRRRFVFGQASWLKAMERYCINRTYKLLHLACRIPQELENVDRLLSCKLPDLIQTSELLYRLYYLESQLKNWLLDWYQSQPGLSPYRYANRTECFPNLFDAQPNTSRTSTAYEFPSMQGALGHSFYWTIMLLLREAIYDLSIWILRKRGLETRIDLIVESCDECAEAICRTVPYIASNLEDAMGIKCMISGLLSTVKKWYKKTDRRTRAIWCDEATSIMVGNVNGAIPICLSRGCNAWLPSVL